MAAQVAPEAIALGKAVVTGLAEERSPLVVTRGPALVMTPIALEVQEPARAGRVVVLAVPVVMSAVCVTGVLPVSGMSIVLANAFVATVFFGARSPIAVVGGCGSGSRQQDRGQSHHCDCEARSVVEKRHGGSPLACPDGFDACSPGKFTCGPDTRSKENTRRMHGNH
jgi:hypothetical protein